MEAASYGSLDGVKHLVEAGAQMDLTNRLGGHNLSLILIRRGDTAMHCAARKGERSVVKYLLASGADFAVQGDSGSVIEVAYAAGHQEIVSLLYKHARKKRSKSRSG